MVWWVTVYPMKYVPGIVVYFCFNYRNWKSQAYLLVENLKASHLSFLYVGDIEVMLGYCFSEMAKGTCYSTSPRQNVTDGVV